MAKNRIFPDVESLRRVVTVPTHTAPGTPLLDAGRPAVTLTGSGDYINTDVITAGNETITIATANSGGISLSPLQAVVTYTGSFAFPVTGATVTDAYEANGQGKKVYITAGGVLDLDPTGNTAYGIVDFFRGSESATDTVVKIGVTL